jgi:SAM-dependent methyltransferase
MKYDNEKTTSNYNALLTEWVSIATRQNVSSAFLFPKIFPYLCVDKGEPILELGAGAGQLVKLANKHGYNVIGSDYADTFVAHMKNEGIKCEKINALTVGDEEYKWKAIFTQGLSVLITKDMETVELAYRSIYMALQSNGRFIFIFPRGNKSKFSRANEQRQIYLNIGFKEIEVFRQQAFPSRYYKFKITHWLESLIGNFIGIRDIIVLEKTS